MQFSFMHPVDLSFIFPFHIYSFNCAWFFYVHFALANNTERGVAINCFPTFTSSQLWNCLQDCPDKGTISFVTSERRYCV